MATYIDKPWLNSYEPGVATETESPDSPLHHILEESARRYPDHTALIFKGSSLTYRQLNEQADAIAAALAANGFK